MSTILSNEKLSEKQLLQVERYIIKKLPVILKQDKEFVLWIEGILAENFPKRDEFNLLVRELKSFREDYDNFKIRVENRFDNIDKRFEQVDKRFEQVDKRFEQVDKRFEQVDKNFQEVYKRLDFIEKEIKTLTRTLGKLGSRWGADAEATFRNSLKHIIEKYYNAKVIHKILLDEEGIIYGKDCKSIEYDIIIINQDFHILIEMKSNASMNDIKNFVDKINFYRDKEKVKTENIIISFSIESENLIDYARNRNIKLITPEEIED